MSLILIAFANKYRLKLKRDPCDGTYIIPGRHGQIYEYSDSELAVMFILLSDQEPSPRTWTSVRRKCVATGMTLRQDGDAEGALIFDPSDLPLAKLAIKIAGIRRVRQISNKHRTKLVDSGSRFKRQEDESTEALWRLGTLAGSRMDLEPTQNEKSGLNDRKSRNRIIEARLCQHSGICQTPAV
jgi:hypothetical protein